MSEIYVIPQITLTDEGPAVTSTIGKGRPLQLIHLQQGSLDGACGPYCLCMALIILGVEKHSKLSNRDHGEHAEKLFSLISNYANTLITEGTDIKFLKKYADIYGNKNISSSFKSATLDGRSALAKSGRKKDHNTVRDFVIENIRKGNPVILGSCYHYALVIGIGYEDKISDDEMPRYLLLLDPSISAPKYSAWNGVIDMGVKGKNWFGTGGFTFEDALALWKD